ncbi:MAG TPA: hypothetical protein PLQ13_08280, partial [Candidatus Krumholzibacteria bacterium]|nr:hypothetical protein [Candidatus Krumholzibacteria bacterium]
VSFAWLPSRSLTVGVRARRQATRLLVDDGGTTSRTDVTLLHLQAEVENAFGRGRVRPLLALAAGGVQVAEGSGALMRMEPSAWHYSVMPAVGVRFAATPRTILRLLLRAPVIWANGDVVAQVDVAGGIAVRF